MLYSKMGNENSDAGHIKCSRGPQFPHPWLKATIWSTSDWVRSYTGHKHVAGHMASF